MAKLNEIQSAILRLDGGQFQKLVDTYIYKKFGYKNIMDYGSHTGTNKTTKGIPDTYFLLNTGKYVFVMYSSHEKSTFKKIKNDILDCLNETKTGIEVSKIQQIICCHTSSNIGPKQDAELRELCSSQGVLLDIFGIGAISQDLLNYYPIIARNELNIAVDSGQILTIDDFVDIYDENPMVTPIGIGILGREAEISESLEKINESKVLLVYGNSGVGKTRLVLEVCRAYIDSHENVICYCIKNNGLSLYEDLKSFVEIGKEYLIFIDDANQTSELRYLIEYVNKKNFNVKIIITVRDYAREHVEKIVRGYIIPEYLLLKPMSKEQINEIMKKELNIINSIFLERINIISKGNPRLAILAGRISKNKSLNDINNVEQLYESYYGKIIEEIDLFQNGTATRIAGLIAFFNTVNLEDANLKESVLFFSEVNSFIFDDIVDRLHDMEIIDLFENSAIKISEQSMGNYLLYYIFAKKRVIRLSDIIRQCFPAYKQKIIYAVNTITKLFNSNENTNYLISEISLVWDELAAKENSNFIEYMKMFYSVKQVETLKYIDGVVDQLDEVPFDAAKINFYKLNNNHHIGDTYLNILDGYKYSLYRKAAIELIIKYFKKRPDMFMDFFFCLTDGFGIDRSSQYNDYIVQQDVIEILILETNNFIEHNVNILFLRVAETFLKLEFHPAESNEDGGVTIYTIPINCTDGSKRYRENMWRSLSEMFIKPVYRDMILGIIESYRKPEYVDTWSKRQSIASEDMVKALFLNLLPGATAYTGNYYPVGSSLKQMNENDLLITYENYLFIVEVKAGSFPQTPPINDFDAHIKAYTKLAQEADSQCTRTIKYISEHQPASFYDAEKNTKFEISRLSDYKEVYSFSVTVDNFNDFAAKAEKLNFITLSSKTIVISYDDLMVYEKYFDSPIYFLHFLKQRKIAIDIPQIELNDELDHLGMYLSHNMYSITASEFPEEHMVNWHGFRQDLDNYFAKLYMPELNAIKPMQEIPEEITEIIRILEGETDENRIDTAHFLLNLSSEAKNDFCRGIHHALRRQPEIGRMVEISAFSEIKYCLFISMPGIKVMSTKERQDYVWATILGDESMPIMWIDLDYDKDRKLRNAKGKQCNYCDIPTGEIDRLKVLSVEITKSRIESFRRQYHRKVGRNDPCPCGSGKKYKKCCIQYE